MKECEPHLWVIRLRSIVESVNEGKCVEDKVDCREKEQWCDLLFDLLLLGLGLGVV